ncbi:MAG: hypothetical protein ABF651_00035 [Sporolactobacillus sp.]
MEKLNLVMDSGKKYTIEVEDIGSFIDQLYNEQRTPSPFSGGGSVFYVIRNQFDKLDEKTYINPAHISSFEVVDE